MPSTLPQPYDVDAYRGDDLRLPARVLLSGEPLDLATVDAIAADLVDASSREKVDAFTVELGDELGELALILTGEQTADLPAVMRWDLQLTIDGLRRTYLAGRIVLHDDVTRP